ncbi:hypothetical protein [Psychrobacter sp.]|uniref:hypothetical protein n=1 Tax=Psychrobacter sp. TaxID=56811 RepID=UPI002FDB1908
MCNDSASVELLGDNTQVLTINVGHDGLKVRAHFITLHDVMNAIAEANSFKVVPVIPDEHAKDAVNHSEYFDAAGKYHVNKPAAKPKAKPVSRKDYFERAGILDFKEAGK